MVSKSYSKGISWIGDCRIPFVDDDKPKGGFGGATIGYGNEYEYDGVCGIANTQGRFPANILVSDDMLNDGIITSQSKRTYKPTDNTASLFGNSPQSHGVGIGDKGSNSRYYDIDKWFNNLIE